VEYREAAAATATAAAAGNAGASARAILPEASSNMVAVGSSMVWRGVCGVVGGNGE